MYPDPSIYSKNGQSDEATYPNTVWSNNEAIYEKPLRSMFGDPLTPGLPATQGMFRRKLNETHLPSIPTQPISYSDAIELLSRMNGKNLPNQQLARLFAVHVFVLEFLSENEHDEN